MKVKYPKQILTLFLLAIPLYAQVGIRDSLINAKTDTVFLTDTLYLKETDTGSVSRGQTDIAKIQKTDTTSKEETKQSLQTSQSLNSNPPEYTFDVLKILKSISLWTLIENLIILLIGISLFRLLGKFSKSGFVLNKGIYLRSIIDFLKILLWLIIIYIIIIRMFGEAKEIFLGLIIIGLVLLGISAVPFLRNVVGGLFILWSRTFEIGDYINIGDFKGKVEVIGWRSTSIITVEGSLVSIPNSLFMENPVTNINIGQKEHLVSVDFEFSSSFNSSVIKQVLEEAALSSPYSYNLKKPKVILKGTDFMNMINKYELNLFLYDAQFEDDLKNSLNETVLRAVNNLKRDS